MAAELLALSANAESPGRLLCAVDKKGTPFLDVLIENEQKEVISHTVVQRYLQELWRPRSIPAPCPPATLRTSPRR